MSVISTNLALSTSSLNYKNLFLVPKNYVPLTCSLVTWVGSNINAISYFQIIIEKISASNILPGSPELFPTCMFLVDYQYTLFDQMLANFISLWKLALTSCFIPDSYEFQYLFLFDLFTGSYGWIHQIDTIIYLL